MIEIPTSNGGQCSKRLLNILNISHMDDGSHNCLKIFKYLHPIKWISF